MKYLVVGWNCLLSSGTEENDIMEIYRRIERITLAFLNWMWRLFILIHEWKNIVGKRKLYKNVRLDNKQKEQIDAFYKKNYGRKVPYLWHRLYTSYTGRFDFRYIPEYIFSTKLEPRRNRRSDVLPFENKNMFSEIFGENIVKQPQMLLMRVKGKYFDEDRNIISEEAAVEKLTQYNCGEYVAFIKVSIDTSSGRGVRLLDMAAGIDRRSNEDLRTVFKKMGQDFIVQERIVPHPAFAALYPQSINTLRVVTYMMQDRIKTAPIAMRIGQRGSVVDNAHAGGMFIGVSDDGMLLNEAFTESRNRYSAHPDTGTIFEGYRIPCVPEIRKVAIKLHEKIPMFQFVSWDFTVDIDGNIVLIEANLHSQSVWFPQISHGKAMFGDDTPQMLHCIKR